MSLSAPVSSCRPVGPYAVCVPSPPSLPVAEIHVSHRASLGSDARRRGRASKSARTPGPWRRDGSGGVSIWMGDERGAARGGRGGGQGRTGAATGGHGWGGGGAAGGAGASGEGLRGGEVGERWEAERWGWLEAATPVSQRVLPGGPGPHGECRRGVCRHGGRRRVRGRAEKVALQERVQRFLGEGARRSGEAAAQEEVARLLAELDTARREALALRSKMAAQTQELHAVRTAAAAAAGAGINEEAASARCRAGLEHGCRQGGRAAVAPCRLGVGLATEQARQRREYALLLKRGGGRGGGGGGLRNRGAPGGRDAPPLAATRRR